MSVKITIRYQTRLFAEELKEGLVDFVHSRLVFDCTLPTASRLDVLPLDELHKKLRDISRQFAVSRSAASRHKGHITELIQSHAVIRADTLEGDILTARDRAENLYQMAERILTAAVKAGDPRAALVAVRTAVSVLAEARSLMELRGAADAACGNGNVLTIEMIDACLRSQASRGSSLRRFKRRCLRITWSDSGRPLEKWARGRTSRLEGFRRFAAKPNTKVDSRPRKETE